MDGAQAMGVDNALEIRGNWVVSGDLRRRNESRPGDVNH